ncbi:hypothetical protein CF327_g7255, partial [Tilletia walkeri]
QHSSFQYETQQKSSGILMEGAKRFDLSREWTALPALRLGIDEQATQTTDLTDSEAEAFNTVAQ